MSDISLRWNIWYHIQQLEITDEIIGPVWVSLDNRELSTHEDPFECWHADELGPIDLLEIRRRVFTGGN